MTPQIDGKLQRFIDLFATALIETWRYKKTPSGTYEQWSTAKSESNIFLQKGFAIWLAYFLVAKRCNGHHYIGQVNDKEVYEAFQREPRDVQDVVASALCQIKIDDSVRQASEKLENMVVEKENPPSKRRRKLAVRYHA
jgi:hypothetical protein